MPEDLQVPLPAEARPLTSGPLLEQCQSGQSVLSAWSTSGPCRLCTRPHSALQAQGCAVQVHFALPAVTACKCKGLSLGPLSPRLSAVPQLCLCHERVPDKQMLDARSNHSCQTQAGNFPPRLSDLRVLLPKESSCPFEPEICQTTRLPSTISSSCEATAELFTRPFAGGIAPGTPR